MSPQILITLIIAVLLGALASFGLYQAAQPAAYQAPSQIYVYGATS